MARPKSDSIEGLSERITSLETKFKIAFALATFLGISVGWLGNWVRTEKNEVAAMQTQIDEMKPIVDKTHAALTAESEKQLQLIRSQAAPIVNSLAQENFKMLNATSQDQIAKLQEDVFFLMYAEVVYPPQRSGKHHDMVNNRKNFILDTSRYGRSKDQLQGTLAQQGYGSN